MRITWKRVVSCGITMSQTEWSVPMELHRNRAGRLGSPSLRQAIFASPLVTWFMVVLERVMVLNLLRKYNGDALGGIRGPGVHCMSGAPRSATLFLTSRANSSEAAERNRSRAHNRAAVRTTFGEVMGMARRPGKGSTAP